MLPEAFSFKKLVSLLRQVVRMLGGGNSVWILASRNRRLCGKVEFFHKEGYLIPGSTHRELKSCGVSLHNVRILMFGFALVTGLTAGEARWLIEGGMEEAQVFRPSERMLGTSARREAPQPLVQRLLPQPLTQRRRYEAMREPGLSRVWSRVQNPRPR